MKHINPIYPYRRLALFIIRWMIASNTFHDDAVDALAKMGRHHRHPLKSSPATRHNKPNHHIRNRL